MKKTATAKTPNSAGARELRIARNGCKFALDLLVEMERQGALRLPFPGHRDTVNLLRAVVERMTPTVARPEKPV